MTRPTPHLASLLGAHLPDGAAGTSRRAVLLAGAGGLAGLLAACGSSATSATSEQGTTGEGSASGPWSFTDDRGETVTLDAVPQRIAGYADQVSALWGFGIAPVGVWHRYQLDADANFTDRDTSEVTVVGSTYGEVDLEALAGLAPDLLVVPGYPADSSGQLTGSLFSFTDQAQQDAAAKIAPIVAIAQKGTSEQIIARNAELAQSLGADPTSAENTEAEAAWRAACDRVRAAAAKGLVVGALYATPSDGMYWAKAADDPGLAFYESLGVQFLPLSTQDYYWEQASWENAGQYTPDVVLYSPIDALDADGLKAQPTFAPTPAAQASQLYPWYFGSMDHVQQTRVLNALADNLEAAQKVTA
ncbi:ABC transporter substrate-binding protein [Quadrisphaera sp. KR29]|uniref:ABC transporter substrate-binding protein n=1 Tax=Quadrisphaera sp. KR29 TaxID=3461391 RepID=UPI004044A648